jgi:glycyl-tRNA synthetase
MNPQNRGLSTALVQARHTVEAAGDDLDLITFTDITTVLTEPVKVFFRDVMVMAEDPNERQGRLALLAGVRDLWDLLDWNALRV